MARTHDSTAVEDWRHIGAAAQTNNTGELTGMYEMVCRALNRPAGAGKEALCTDSLYAKHMTTRALEIPSVKRNAMKYDDSVPIVRL